jgi:hypothetical protein
MSEQTEVQAVLASEEALDRRFTFNDPLLTSVCLNEHSFARCITDTDMSKQDWKRMRKRILHEVR